jgi:dTDP-4-dehydrorhamnose reductase
VVTGAGGMLGRAVVDRFATGHEVLAMQRGDADLADLRAAVRWIEAARPDHVVHCAAWTDVDGCEADPERAWRDNAWATRNVAIAAQLAGATLCHLSTDYVFDGAKSEPYLEDDATGPLGVYGRTKLVSELQVRRHAPRHTIVRTSWLFGPGGRNFVRTVAGLVAERAEIRVVADQRGAPTHVADLADCLLALVDSGLEGTYHVTNTGECTWYDLARRVGARLRPGCRVVACTSAEFPRPARRPANSRLAMARYRAAGLPLPRPWEAAVDDYLAMLGGRGEP